MRKFIFLCFLSILGSFLQAQNNHHLEFTLKGFQFDALIIEPIDNITGKGPFSGERQMTDVRGHLRCQTVFGKI